MSTLTMHAGSVLWSLFFAVAHPAGGGRDETPERELVLRAKRGDPRALQDLYQRYADTVYRRLTHLLGPDPEREDLLQEVFIALFKSLQAFRGEASLRTYVYRIVANKAYDHLKKRRRTKALVTSVSDVSGVMAGDSAPSPEMTALSNEDAALFWSSLDQLKPKKRIAFILRVVEAQSLKEISQQVGASVHTVAQRIRHAKMELIALVGKKREAGR